MLLSLVNKHALSIINYDDGCFHGDRMVSLDRIQDVSISQNCFQSFWDVTDLGVETASGGKGPEITIMAVKNPQRVRDEIISRRDQVAQASNGTDGFRTLFSKGAFVGADALAGDAAASKELKTMNETLARIEKLLELGLQNFGSNGNVQAQEKIDHNQDSETSNLLN